MIWGGGVADALLIGFLMPLPSLYACLRVTIDVHTFIYFFSLSEKKAEERQYTYPGR